MPASPKQTIFISHSSANKNVTDELYDALTRRYQLTCWVDAFNLHADQGPFSGEIVKAIKGSKLLALVDSPASRQSDYVHREIQLARDLQIPIYRCSIDENQSPFLRRIKIQWLALSIQVRLVRGFLFAALMLFLLLAVMALGIFLLGTRVVPVLANANLRDLPAAFRPTPTSTATPNPSDPKVAAPFHFKPDTTLLQDDFDDQRFDNSFNNQIIYYDISPRDPQVKVGQQNGILVIYFPARCLSEERRWDCELQMNSNVLNLATIQYFGFRARTVGRTSLRDVSVSISINEPNRSRAGFGWDVTDHAMAFFRSIPPFPEKDLYAYVNINSGWHAYEILRDVKTATYYYYVDGQLVDTYSPVHAQEWDQAPLQLIIYSMTSLMNNEGEQADTRFEMDEFIIGGFNGQ